MNCLQPFVLLKELFRHQHFINKVLRIKRFAVHLQLIKIDIHIFKTVAIQMVFLPHRNAIILIRFYIILFIFLISISFILFNLNSIFLNKFRVFEHLDHFFEVDEPRVYPKSDWQLFIKSLFESVKLIIGLDDVFELDFVILIEFSRSNFVPNQLVISILRFLTPGNPLVLFSSLSLLFTFVVVNLFEPVTSETLLSLVLSLLSGCLPTLGILFLFHKIRL